MIYFVNVLSFPLWHRVRIRLVKTTVNLLCSLMTDALNLWLVSHALRCHNPHYLVAMLFHLSSCWWTYVHIVFRKTRPACALALSCWWLDEFATWMLKEAHALSTLWRWSHLVKVFVGLKLLTLSRCSAWIHSLPLPMTCSHSALNNVLILLPSNRLYFLSSLCNLNVLW